MVSVSSRLSESSHACLIPAGEASAPVTWRVSSSNRLLNLVATTTHVINVSNLLNVMQQMQEMSETRQENLRYRLAGKISLSNSALSLPFDYQGELTYAHTPPESPRLARMKLPSGAMSPDEAAERILAAYRDGYRGLMDL